MYQERLEAYMAQHDLQGAAALVVHLRKETGKAVPRTTVQNWLKGLKPAKKYRKLLDDLLAGKHKSPILDRVVKLAGDQIIVLTPLLRQLVNEDDSTYRVRLRQDLGGSFHEFLEAVRAITSEMMRERVLSDRKEVAVD